MQRKGEGRVFVESDGLMVVLFSCNPACQLLAGVQYCSMPYCTGTCTVARGSTVQIGQLLYDLPLIGKVLAYAAAAAGQVKV